MSRASVFGLFAALLSSAGQTFFIGAFGASFRSEFALSDGLFGSFYGAATLASGLLMFWLGAIADRYSPSQAITLSLAVLGGGALLCAIAPTAWWLLPGLLLLRLGGQGLTGHIAIVVAARNGGVRHGRSIATAAFGFIIGEALLPTAIAAGLGVLDWRWLWLLVGMFVLVAAIPLMRVLASPLVNAAAMTGGDGHSGEGTVAKASTRAAAGAGAAADVNARAGAAHAQTTFMTRRSLLTDRRFLAPMSVLLVPPFVVTAIFLHQNGLGALRGWSQAQIAAAFVGFALSQLIATFTAGRLVDAFGSVKLMRVYLWGLAVGVLGLGHVDGLAGLWLLFCGLGITAGSNNVLAGAVWLEVFGASQVGMIRGVYAALMVLATALSPPLLGLALDAGIALGWLALGTAAYAVIMPPLAMRRLRAADSVM